MPVLSRRFSLVDAGAAAAVVLAIGGVVWSPKLSGAAAPCNLTAFHFAPQILHHHLLTIADAQNGKAQIINPFRWAG